MNLDPLHQFMVTEIIPLYWGRWNFSLTNSGAFMLGIAAFLMLFFFVSFKKRRLMPGKLQALAELPLSFVYKTVMENNGEKALPFLSFTLAVFLFVLSANLLGMVPFAFTITSQIIINFVLALMVLVVITVCGIIKLRGAFFRVFCMAGVPLWITPLLVPIEIISYLSRCFSLSIRLFANMVAGHSMMKIFSYFSAQMGPWGVLPTTVNVALVGFEFLVAFLQAYVFLVLTCIYFNDGLKAH